MITFENYIRDANEFAPISTHTTISKITTAHPEPKPRANVTEERAPLYGDALVQLNLEEFSGVLVEHTYCLVAKYQSRHTH